MRRNVKRLGAVLLAGMLLVGNAVPVGVVGNDMNLDWFGFGNPEDWAPSGMVKKDGPEKHGNRKAPGKIEAKDFDILYVNEKNDTEIIG